MLHRERRTAAASEIGAAICFARIPAARPLQRLHSAATALHHAANVPDQIPNAASLIQENAALVARRQHHEGRRDDPDIGGRVYCGRVTVAPVLVGTCRLQPGCNPSNQCLERLLRG